LKTEPSRWDRLLWPVGITVALIIVVVVNAIFIYVAVSGADDVAPSYNTEPR
jgi:hypothetical protein